MSDHVYKIKKFQANYLEPVIINQWSIKQQEVLAECRELGGDLVVAGDARSDSPGHCAKYGSFTMIDCRINKIVDMQLVQVNHVQEFHNSSTMNKKL